MLPPTPYLEYKISGKSTFLILRSGFMNVDLTEVDRYSQGFVILLSITNFCQEITLSQYS